MTKTEKYAAILALACIVALLPLVALAQVALPPDPTPTDYSGPRVLGGPDPTPVIDPVPVEGSQVTETATVPGAAAAEAKRDPEDLVAVRVKDTAGWREALLWLVTVVVPQVLVRFTTMETFSAKAKLWAAAGLAIIPPIAAMLISPEITATEAGTIAMVGAGGTAQLHNWLKQYAPIMAAPAGAQRGRG